MCTKIETMPAWNLPCTLKDYDKDSAAARRLLTTPILTKSITNTIRENLFTSDSGPMPTESSAGSRISTLTLAGHHGKNYHNSQQTDTITNTLQHILSVLYAGCEQRAWWKCT